MDAFLYLQTISNADFWQIANIVALDIARSDLNPKLNITFKGGRKDCSTSPTTDVQHLYPQAFFNRSYMMKWFKEDPNGFGVNEQQVNFLLQQHCDST